MKTEPIIFINYRREDSAGDAGRISDRLFQEFGKDKVFIDVDTIPLGVDFIKYLESQVAKCDVLLAVIGRQWLKITDNTGKRRIDNEKDFVTIEIMAALRRNIRVIPLLVQNSSMPTQDELPSNLKALASRNGISIRHEHFHDDMTKLIKGIKEYFRYDEENDYAIEEEEKEVVHHRSGRKKKGKKPNKFNSRHTEALLEVSIEDLRAANEALTGNRKKSKIENLEDIAESMKSIKDVLEMFGMDSLKAMADYLDIPRRKSKDEQIDEIILSYRNH